MKTQQFKKSIDSIEKIAVIYNLKRKKDSDDEEEYDEKETVYALRKEIEKYGFEVVLLEENKSFLKKISQIKIDFAVNITEGRGNLRTRESLVPCILDSMCIPYSGSDGLSLGITLDKYLTHTFLKSAKIPVPQVFLVKDRNDLYSLKEIFKKEEYFIIKPRWEGSSKGIFQDSLVKNFNQLRKKVVFIWERYNQPSLVEEFLPNDEITVGVSGNKKPYLLGMMKIVPKDKPSLPFVYSIENKRMWQEKIEYKPQESIPDKIQELIEDYALRAFSLLELKDLARIDFRLDKNNHPKIIDINPLPGLSPSYSDLSILYNLKGRSYSELIKRFLHESFKRYGFNFPE